MLPAWLSAQTNITQAEYWYDGDFGTANRQTVSGTSVNYTELLDVSSLNPGLHTFTIRFQDTRGVWGSVLTRFFTYYPSTSTGIHLVTDVEYWFNGIYSSAIETSLTSGTSVDWNSLLNVNALNNGLHTVSFRFKDDRGIWGAPKTSFFKKESNTGLQQIVALEYWLNNDYANKASRSFSPTSLLNFNDMIDVSSLSIGFHFVNFRLQDESGKWGPTSSWYFTKENEETTIELHPITEMEYWFDGNYSTVQTDPISTTSTLNLDTDLNVSDLTDGLHYVSTRFKDETGNWSPAFSRLFAKYPSYPAEAMHELTALEYWIDGDISTTVKTPVSPGSEYVLNTQLDISALNDGLHTITYRFQDEAGVWSPAYSELFSKYEEEEVATGNKITEYRYWVNDQIGSATEVTLPTPVKMLELDKLVDVSSLPRGTNNITFQFKDSVGLWSGAYTESYTQDFNPRGTITAETDPVCTQSLATFTAETFDTDSIYWNFGDGTAIVGQTSAEDAYHAYSNTGDYTVSAILKKSGSGNSDTVNTGISVNQSYGVSVVAPANLLAYYPLNGDAVDAGNFGHDGTVFEATPTTDRNGNTNQAFYFDGVNDYIDLGDWENGGPMSFTFWARWDAFNNYSRIIDLGNGSSSNNIIVANYQTGNTFLFSIYKNSSETQFRSTSAITSGKWDYFAVTVDNNGIMTIYKNGIQIEQKLNGVTPNKLLRSAQFIGKSNFSADGYFKGAIDELKIYNKALSADEIRLDYEGTGGMALPPVDVEICASETPYTFGTQQLSASGTYYENFPAVNGCDSLVQLNLTVHPVYNDTIGEPLNYLVDDDFENDALGSLPDGWTIRYNGTSTSDQKVVASPVKNGVHSFQVSGSSWSANMSKAVSGLPETVTLEAWVRIENVVSGGACGLSLGNPSIATWGSFLGRVETENGNFITYNHSGSATTKYILQPAIAGPWTHIKIEYDFSSFKYKVFINGQQTSGTSGSNTVTEFPLLETVAPTSVELYGNSLVYFDDVKLYESGHTALTICSSETPYEFGNQQLSSSGTYTETFKSAFGCDSTVTLNLIVNPSYEISDSATICETELPFHLGDSVFTVPGVYTQIFTTQNGCDSIHHFTLIVNDTSLVEQEISVCENELPLIIGTDTFKTGGIYTEVFNNIMGCDSTVILTLNVTDTSLVTEEIEICKSLLPYNFGTQSLNASGVYSETFTKTNGCDSTVILNLTVKDTFIVADSISICESELPYLWEGDQLLSTGTYTKVLTAANGCDSTVNLLFTVNDTSLVQQEITVCKNDLPYILGSQTLTSPGIYTEILTAQNGCDSTVVLSLNVTDTLVTHLSVSVCQNELPYIWESQSLDTSGIYTETFTSGSGCDSTVILALTVNDTFNVEDTVTICENELPYEFGSQVLINDGTYTETFLSSAGCDSIVVLEFSVSDTFNSEYRDTICENDLPYLLGSQSINSSGTYIEAFMATNGCDSVVTLHLKVNESYETNLNVTIDKTDLPYSFGTQQLSKAGVYTRSLSTIFGCDSIITLNLKVRDNIPPLVVCNAIAIELQPNGTYILTATDEDAIIQGTSDDITASNDLVVQVSPSSFTCENMGETTVAVSISDAAGNESSCQTTVLVTMQASSPTLDDISDLVINEDDSASIKLTGISGGNMCEKWNVDVTATSRNAGLVAGLSVDHLPSDSTATLNIRLVPDQSGSDSIFVEVSDSLEATITKGFLLSVNPVNDPPIRIETLADEMMRANDTLTVSVNKENGKLFSDIDDNDLIFSFQTGDTASTSWITATENGEFYQITFTPSLADTGCINIIIAASDAFGETVSDTFGLCVSPIVGINELDLNKFEIALYPNPSSRTVNIDLFNPPFGEIKLQVTNITGSEVLRKSYKNGERIVFDLSGQVSGTYLVTLMIKNKRIVRKLILDKK